MMRASLLAAAAAIAVAVPIEGQAAVVTAAYTQIANSNKWATDFTVFNNGAPAVLTGLTIYFPQATFSNLLLYKAPAGWDSLVIQPDAALSSPGYFDTFAIDASRALTAGQSQGGFEVRFTYTGIGAPGSLAFEINDSAYNVLSSGMTTPVPEPTSAAMSVAGLFAVAAFLVRKRKQTLNATGSEVQA